MKKHILLSLIFFSIKPYAKENLDGRVLAKEARETIPLIGANVFWLNTQIGTITDEDGKFSLPYLGPEELLVMSYIGFKSDTLITRSSSGPR